VLAYQRHGNGQYFLLRQTLYAAAGFVLLAILTRWDYHRIRPLTYPPLGIGNCTGSADCYQARSRRRRRGALDSHWAYPRAASEVAKLVLIVWLAYSLSKKSENIRSFSIGFLPHLLMAIFLMGLCLGQPISAAR